VVVRSVLDSELASSTVAPATAFPLGSITVPRTEVVACPFAQLPIISSAKTAAKVRSSIQEAGLPQAGVMREEADLAARKSRATSDTPFVRRDFSVFMIRTSLSS